MEVNIQSLAEPAIKLIDAVQGAIGKAYEPHHHKRMTDAEVYRIAEYSKVIRENSDLPIEHKGDELRINIADFEKLIKRTENRLVIQEVRRQENIEKIADLAFDYLQKENSQSEEKVDSEWMTRFINMSGDITSEDMQLIWAKVLTGEILKPGAYSMKTLECLRNLNAKDALLFESISAFVVGGDFIIHDDELNEKYGFNYKDILSLDELGLLNSSGIISLNVKLVKEPRMVLDYGKYVLFASAEENTVLSVQEFPLTRAGRELFNVIINSNSDNISEKIENNAGNYLKDFISKIQASNPNVSFYLHEIIERNEKKITYKKENIV